MLQPFELLKKSVRKEAYLMALKVARFIIKMNFKRKIVFAFVRV